MFCLTKAEMTYRELDDNMQWSLDDNSYNFGLVVEYTRSTYYQKTNLNTIQ
jgi:hypothetical protein